MEIGTLAKSYISCTQISLLCRTRGSAECQGLNTEDKSFCGHKPFFRSEKAEANSPQELGLHKWIFGGNLPLYILMRICVNYRLCSRIQSPGLKRIINTYHSMPNVYQYFRARSEKPKKKCLPPPHPHPPQNKRFWSKHSRYDNLLIEAKMYDMEKDSLITNGTKWGYMSS